MRRLRLFSVSTLSLLVLLATAAFAAPETVLIWLSGEPGTVNAWTDLGAKYAADHPGVTVKVTFIGSDIYSPTIVPALSSGQGPDIFGFGTGPGQPAAIVSARLVADLTPYFYKYNWGKFISDSIINQVSSDGKLWAVPDSVETTGFYYNKAIFAKLGLSVPTTLDQFNSVMDKLKAAGYATPIGLGGADRWPISHEQSMLFGRFAGPQGLQNVLFGNGRWDDAPFVQAATIFQDWAKKGYFGPAPLAVNYSAVNDKFWNGDIPTFFTGDWIIGDAAQTIGDRIKDYGVFPMPAMTATQKIYPSVGIGNGFYINAQSKVKDTAADVLNYMLFTPDSRKALLQTGVDVPIGPLSDIIDQTNVPQLRKDFWAIIEKYGPNGTIPAYLDTLEPDHTTEVTYDSLQQLLAGKVTPLQFCQQIQAAWADDKAKGLILKAGGGLTPP